jgi:hypothetical protein
MENCNTGRYEGRRELYRDKVKTVLFTAIFSYIIGIIKSTMGWTASVARKGEMRNHPAEKNMKRRVSLGDQNADQTVILGSALKKQCLRI